MNKTSTSSPVSTRSSLAEPMSSRRQRPAFTLLEVLLTLSLSVVLMGLVGGALRFYAVDMNVRDMDVRQTQLAAAVMQMIEDDLRATLHTEPVDTSGLEALLASTASNATGGGGGGDAASETAGEDLSAAGIESEETEEMSEPIDTSTLDLQSGAAVLKTPGLIGNQFQIQIDLSRLPRLEEYMAILDGTTANIDDVPSDLKTVSYFVQPAGTIGGVEDPLSAIEAELNELDAEQSQGGGGLVRRSLDRSVTVYAATTGSSMMLNQTGELLAPEITGIEFAYWDGLTWQMQWSSDEMGELPLAVQVRLYMATPTAAMSSSALTDPSDIRTFLHVVRLPLARPIEEEEEDLTGAGI